LDRIDHRPAAALRCAAVEDCSGEARQGRASLNPARLIWNYPSVAGRQPALGRSSRSSHESTQPREPIAPSRR